MANGDTKTEALLRILGHGGSYDGISGSGNTKTQDLLVDAIGRIQNVEDDVEELKNNPDVVDIVDTYADLQAYDTSTLTDKDIIRVLEDSTHSNGSTYYRWNATTNQFDYIGEAGGGGDAGSLILYASADEITNGSTIQFYDAADFDHSVSISTIHAAASSGRDIKIIVRNPSETDWSERTTYTVYKAYYPKTCTDESMDEWGMNLYVIGGLGTQASTRKAISFNTFSGPTYDNFTVGIESF